MVRRTFCSKIAIWSGRNAYFCFQRLVLCQWCQSDASKTSKNHMFFNFQATRVAGRVRKGCLLDCIFISIVKNQGSDNILPQNRHMDESRVGTSTVSMARSPWLGLLGGYWMSWRLAYDSPPIDNRRPTTTNQQPTQKRTQERQPTITNQPTNQSTTDNQ